MIKQEYKTMLERMALITDIDINKLEKRREYPCPFCRYIITNTLRKKNYSWKQLSTVTGFDHATLIYGDRKITYILSNNFLGYELVRRIYNEFINDLK